LLLQELLSSETPAYANAVWVLKNARSQGSSCSLGKLCASLLRMLDLSASSQRCRLLYEHVVLELLQLGRR
jgi:hypothetical protein